MGWLVPSLDNDAGIAARLGHVLFYLGAGMAFLFCAGAIWTGLADRGNHAAVLVCAGFAAFFYLVGRGLCYIFSGD